MTRRTSHRAGESVPARLPKEDELTASRGKASAGKLDDMLRKVRALLAQADHENTSPTEAQAFRAKAEALMFRYRIDEAMLAQAPDSGIDVEWSYIDVCDLHSHYRHFYEGIMQAVCEHVGVRWHREFETAEENEDGVRRRVARIHYVGFPSDIRVVDALFTSAQLAFSAKLEPKYNPELSDQVNAYNMRHAGMEGWRIAMAIWGQREDKDLYRARRLFKREALERGEDPNVLLGQGNSMAVYRDSYANGFYWELRTRLFDMRSSRGERSHAVELGGRKERINEAFYSRYPQYAPPKAAIGFVPDEEEVEEDKEYRCPHCDVVVEAGKTRCPECEGRIDWGESRGHTRGAYSDPRENCSKCQKAKSGYCRDHSYLRPSTARTPERAHNRAGERAGRNAARSVDLGSGGPRRLT